MRTWISTLILVLFIAPLAQAQTGVSRLKKTSPPRQAKSPWQTSFMYSALTDYADNRTPRSYIHSIVATTSYDFDRHWNLGAAFGARAETVNGQIAKGREQTYDETLGPSTSLTLSYNDSFYSRHNYSLYLDAEPLWDEASRQEGYKGLIGIGGKVSLGFFRKRYIMSHGLSVSELINTYSYGSNDLPNPDYFFTYKLANVLKIYRGFRASYTFGIKVTRYMDDFVGYSYSNSLGISHSWQNWMAGLSYDNGGFVDEGQVSLWFIDEYRRLARVTLGYTF